MSEDALARAREIAARLSGTLLGSDLGKRKTRYGEDETGAPGLGSIQRKKIFIPTSGDINYLGLLIGPKGQTQKHMQESTGAKILIRGKGSAKDGGSSGFADEDEELHVIIEGSEDAVSRAAKEVEKILFDPEQALRLKSEQLRQLGSRDADSIYGGGDTYQVELRVANNMVGLIIGKGGENVLRIQSQMGVSIQVAKESEMRPGETQRTIIIKGPQSNVDDAKRRIDEIIDEHNSKFTRADRGRGHDLNCPFVVKLPVPNDKVGIIIGKSGMTIKGIQDRTRASIQIPQIPDDENPGVRTVIIGGDTKEILDAAQMEIFLIIQQQQMSPTGPLSAPANALLMMVPDDKVGVIIGRGGATVKEMQNRHNVRIQIPQQPDIGSNPPVRTVSIQGTQEAMAAAKYEIEMVAAGGSIGGGGGGGGGHDKYGGGGGGSYGGGPWGGGGAAYYGGGNAGASAYAGYSYNDMATYYAQYAANAAAAAAAVSSTTAAASSDPNDPTAYYKDFWQYASYYGEAAARLYYGAWSPPAGTPAPPGIVVAADPATHGKAPVATHAPAAATTSAARDDPEAAGKAWEAYRKQYAEWYEAHGKAQGADPNPPAM